MSCNCTPPLKTPLWTAVPEYRQSTDIQPGENIECYALRSGSVSGEKNDNGAKIPDRIDNTSLTSDLDLNVNTTFKLTDGSTRTPTSWTITIDGASGLGPLTELTFDTTSGILTGTVIEANANKQYKVMIIAIDATGMIDSREFNFFPKKAVKGQTLQFIKPLADNSGQSKGTAHVTCAYGPRKPPAPGASSMHLGIDMAMTDHLPGNIVAACDGTVVAAGPATGFGNWIKIEHYDENGVCVATSVYGHMNNGNLYVTVGQKVGAGQKIALEGNNGIGSACHLHFEIHKGKWKPGGGIDPMPYLNGAIPVANNNDPSAPQVDGGTAPSGGATVVNNTAAGMTTAEATTQPTCPATIPGDGGGSNGDPEQVPPAPANNVNKNRSACALAVTPTSTEVLAAIQQACDDDGTLSATDVSFLKTVATIESGLDPAAKNPTSSATGLYQMLDSIAASYFPKVGLAPTCENRCDAYKATKAMIAFYKQEFLPYWNGFNASGQTKIANKTIQQTSWSATYPTLTQGEFMYGLIHHDGVGNAVAGLDRQGVSYWRSKVGTA